MGDADSQFEDGFRTVVVSAPSDGLSVRAELPLVKAALLYGDQVRLLSPAATMLTSLEAVESWRLDEQLELLRLVLPHVEKPPVDAATMRELQRVARQGRLGGSLKQRQLRVSLERELAPAMTELVAQCLEMAHDAGLTALERARRERLLEVETVALGQEVEFLASCVVRAKRAEQGATEEDAAFDWFFDEFLERLSAHLSSGRDYLIFDEEMASVAEQGIREGIFTPVEGPAGRAAQAMTAASMVARLPSFPAATLDEVIEVRRELTKPLVGFRSAMVAVADEFNSEAWETSFDDEVHDAWNGKVAPALQEIDEAIKTNRSLLELASLTASTAHTAFPGLLLVVAGLSETATAIGGTLGVGAPVLKALQQRRSSMREIRMKPFFFLYGAEQAMRGHN